MRGLPHLVVLGLVPEFEGLLVQLLVLVLELLDPLVEILDLAP